MLKVTQEVSGLGCECWSATSRAYTLASVWTHKCFLFPCVPRRGCSHSEGCGVGSLPKSRDPYWVRIINNPATVMCWEGGQCGFCPLPFLETSLHTALSAWATPRALMFLPRPSAHSGSCPPGELRGHLNSFPASGNQSAANKIVSPGSLEPSKSEC